MTYGNEIEGIGQCILDYRYNEADARCGMTFLQSGVTPIVFLSGLGYGVSVSNSIEQAATATYQKYFLHAQPCDIIFFEHNYHRASKENSFYLVKMTWNSREESFKHPKFEGISSVELEHMLSCYGYYRQQLPDMRFESAKVISFSKYQK